MRGDDGKFSSIEVCWIGSPRRVMYEHCTVLKIRCVKADENEDMLKMTKREDKDG